MLVLVRLSTARTARNVVVMSDMYEAYAASLMDTFGKPQLVLTHGDGVYVEDSDGKRYLDLLAGIAVNALGHRHPVLVEAISRQAGEMIHVSNFFATPAQINLAQKLQGILEAEGYDGSSARVFFTNSGAEGNEAALKLARLHKKNGRVLALTHSFHGRTMGALTLTHKQAYREPFEPLAGVADFVEPDISALEAAFDDDVAAIFLEPIQGEAGVIPLPDGFMERARELCDTHDALLVVDEVQTGMGRTGRWLASAPYVKADVITLAKGLGGGVPSGACIGIGAAAKLFHPGNHGTTFGGNPLACAASLATLGEVEKLFEQVNEVSAWLTARLEAAGYAVRGRGLLLGIDVADSTAVRQELLKEGVIVNAPNPTTIRLAPALIITAKELEPFVEIMSRRATEFQGKK